MNYEQSQVDVSELANPHRVRHAFANVVTFLCSVALIPLVLFIGAWILHSEPLPSLVVLQAGMGYVLLIAYPIFVFAAFANRKILAAVAAFIMVSHLYLYASEWKPATDLPDSAKSAPRITLLSHNIRFDNPTPLAEVDEINEVDADIVFLQELTTSTLASLDSAGAFQHYPHRAVLTHRGATGLGIFSKFPLKDAERIESAGFPQQRATAEIQGRTVTLWNVHTQSPVGGPIDRWKADLDQLKFKLHAEQGDVIAAGDFNATWSHRPFRDIVSKGYREAAADRGRGFARTWPVNGRLSERVKGFIRIDHVLTRGSVRPTAIHERGGAGSDHRGIVSQLVLLPPP